MPLHETEAKVDLAQLELEHSFLFPVAADYNDYRLVFTV